MKHSARALLIAVTVLVAAALGFWIGQRKAGAKSKADSDDEAPTTQSAREKPMARVQTAIVKKGRISETITAYGTVVAQSGDVRILSVPFESRITRILVTPGEQVRAGAEVVQLQASPAALVSLQEAKNAAAAAERDLAQTQQRLTDHLATNVELSQTHQASQSAKLKLDTLIQQGVGTPQKLKSDFDGIVNKIDVQDGQIVPAGGPLVEIASGKQIEVALGVEPDDIPFLKPNQEVALTTIGRSTSDPLTGHIRLIGQRVDPATRLAAVIVSLPPDAHLMLETYVSGKVTKASSEGLIVPRQAVLPEDDGTYSLFTIKDDHAVKHSVRVGLETTNQTQIVSDDVKDGDRVIIEGNYELEDGIQVKERETSISPASAPTTSPAAAARDRAPVIPSAARNPSVAVVISRSVAVSGCFTSFSMTNSPVTAAMADVVQTTESAP